MKKRLATSSVILILTLGFVLLKQFHSLFFDAFVLFILYNCVYEIIKTYKITSKKVDTVSLYIIPLGMWVINYFCSINITFVLLLAVAVLLLMVVLTEEIFEFAKNRKNGTTETDEKILNNNLFNKTKNTMMVFAYPILPVSMLFAINHLPYEIGYIGIVLAFVVAMMTDSFAYLIGCAFGKKKFIPEVSPKKSIAGVFGGFFGAIIGVAVCFVFFYFTPWFSFLNITKLSLTIPAFVTLAIVGSWANQLGDLVASAVKRKAEIKDYSNIFPGHGGFMDRVDGLMMVSVVVFVVMVLFFV